MNNIVIFRLSFAAMLLTIPYAAQWYYQDIDAAQEALYPPIKPFAYRVLLPWIGQGLLRIFPFRLDLLVIALMVISGIAFMFSLHYLYFTFYPFTRWTELQLIAMYGVFVALFSRYPKIYDLAAAALFTFSLASLARRRYREYLVIFAIATLNRETIRLRRYNGKSHEHTNKIESQKFGGYHIHQATERYQQSGTREDEYAEPTRRYSDLHGAFRCMIGDCKFIEPSNAQMSF